MFPETIAMICHEANRALCIAHGDFSQKSWEDAEEWQRQSAIKGVQFRLANPDAPASAQHEAWMRDKEADGWKYGPVKDPFAKTHPCMLPYDQLPIADQRKDSLFAAVVDALRPPAEVQNGDPKLTFGQKVVDLRFNHAAGATHDAVHQCKQSFANVIDQIGDPSADTERRTWAYNVLRTAAINACVAAQMAVVKFLTWHE